MSSGEEGTDVNIVNNAISVMMPPARVGRVPHSPSQTKTTAKTTTKTV